MNNQKFFNPYEDCYFYNSKRELDDLTKIGKEINELQVVKELPGNMARIYVVLRKDDDPNKDSKFCVLKIFDSVLFNSMQLLEISREGFILSKARNPYILKIEDVFRKSSIDGSVQISLKLPYCAGGSLRDKCKQKPLSVHESIFHLLNILIALDKLHKKSIVHGDLKPENILFLDCGYQLTDKQTEPNSIGWRTVLADFGLSKYTTDIVEKIRFKGTSRYAAPEQLIGGDISNKVDIWSWGLIAWEIIANEHPYESFGKVHYGLKPTEFREFLSAQFILQRLNLPEKNLKWLAELINECLSFDPALRPNTKELIFRFQEHICFHWEGNYVGQFLQKSYSKYSLNLSSLNLLEDLQNEYGWNRYTDTFNEIKFTRKLSLSWFDQYKKFERLVQLRNSEAITLMNNVLGEFESKGSIFNQIIENSEQTSYIINQDNFNSIGNEIPRDIILAFIDGSLIVLIDIVQKINSAHDLKVLELLSNFCFSIPNILVESAQYSRLSQSFLLLGDYEISLYCNDQANKIAKTNHDYTQVYDNYFFIHKATFNYASNFELLKERISFLQQNENMLVWRTRQAMLLIESRYYCQALAALNEMPYDLSVAVMTFICSYYLNAKLYCEEWKEIKSHIFRLQNISYQMMLPVIECAWIYGEQEFCMKRAQSLLVEPAITLPMNSYYKGHFESYASGNSP
jgi:serine/threonine protein kinase